ncbi:hypothetical protein RUK64_001338 [Vibrio cholerae]|nr:hypothetical protein [Vibrio cholerae]ELJ8693498.1 hypothetical protein [Vibrio cholerae]
MDKSPSLNLEIHLRVGLLITNLIVKNKKKSQNCEPFPADVNRTLAVYIKTLNGNTKTTDSLVKEKTSGYA